MHSTANIFIFPNGTEFEILRDSEETDGRFLEMEMRIFPGDSSTPIHIHPAQVEEYQVLSGTFDVNLDGMWQQHDAGDKIIIPAGVPHTFRNSSGKVTKVLNYHTPSLSFEQYIRTLGHLIMTEKVVEGRFSGFVYISMLWQKHSDVIRPVGSMRILMPILAMWGNLLGYKLDE